MNRASPGARVELPQWFARLALDAAGDERESEGSASEETVRIGPITVFHPSKGCETATFGPGGSSAVLFDGYLFDRASIAEELGLGEVTAAAPAIVAKAYERWGADLFDKLDGCYLIAIWDAAAGQFVIGHDALGRHPVFYAPQGSRIWLASNLLTLARSGHVGTHPNRLSLALGALLYWPVEGQTFLEGVRRLRPGHYLEVKRHGEAIERKYWEPMPDDDEPWLADRDVLDSFEPALVRSVARCMDLGAQGIMLSGGVDSVTIAALASEYGKQQARPPLIAVSGRTGQALSGEERMQSKVAEALGMPHEISTSLEWRDGRDGISLSLDAVGDLPSPTNIWWVGTYMRFYRRTAAQGLTVLLTGAGGDNWLGVADTHAADLMRRLQFVQLARFLKADVTTGGASLGGAIRRRIWGSGMRPHLDSMWAMVSPSTKEVYHRRKWRERLPVWLSPDRELREALIDHLMTRRTPSLTTAGRIPRSYYRHSLRSMSNPYMHHENETAFHIESMCGLRLLSPYHDRRLVSFFNRISPRVLVHSDRYKGLLRPVVAKYLPQQLGLEDQRKDYPAEEQDRKLTELRGWIASAWTNHGFDILGDLGVIDPRAAVTEIDRDARRGFEELAQMFVLMSSERWVRTNAAA